MCGAGPFLQGIRLLNPLLGQDRFPLIWPNGPVTIVKLPYRSIRFFFVPIFPTYLPTMKVAKNWHEQHLAQITFGNKVADSVAKGMGSWGFIIIQTVLVAIWMGLNIVGYCYHWDAYPFILLNLLFSTQAAYAAPIIMMSQNRQSERDRTQAQADYATNLEAKQEIEALSRKLAQIETEKLDRILKLLEQMESVSKAVPNTDTDR